MSVVNNTRRRRAALEEIAQEPPVIRQESFVDNRIEEENYFVSKIIGCIKYMVGSLPHGSACVILWLFINAFLSYWSILMNHFIGSHTATFNTHIADAFRVFPWEFMLFFLYGLGMHLSGKIKTFRETLELFMVFSVWIGMLCVISGIEILKKSKGTIVYDTFREMWRMISGRS